MTASFPVSELNKVRRLHERGRYDKDGVYAVLDAAIDERELPQDLRNVTPE